MSSIGKSVKRMDAYEKVTGKAKYAGDIVLPDMLHLQIVSSSKPHANIKSIDTRHALKMPGIRAVLTAADVPNNRCGLIKPDREVLCSSVVRFRGDPIAAVVADTESQARAAVDEVIIDYEELPVLDDPQNALAPGAILIHTDCPQNILFSQDYQMGDVDQAISQSAIVIDREYTTPMQEHVYLETEAGVGYMGDDDVVTIICAGQNTHDDQRQIAQALDLPIDAVRVIYGPIGGAFGGREEVSIQIILALAVITLKRPIKIIWNRAESIQGHCKRHAMTMRYKWGADLNGKITAAEMEIIADAGAYDYGSISVLKNYLYAAVGPYEIPNVRLNMKAVYTNNVPGGAFRGYGFPQITFASELQIAHIADRLGIDPVSVRLANCYREGSKLPSAGSVPEGVNLERLLAACADGIGFNHRSGKWTAPPTTATGPDKKRGIGIAAGMKSCGFSLGFPEGSEAAVVLEGGAEIEMVTVITAAADVGQGAHTVLCQIAADALDLPMEMIQIIPSDTRLIGDAGPAAASRLTQYAGNAVKFAAENALNKWRNEERPAKGFSDWKAPKTSAEPGEGRLGQVNSISYGAHAVELEVDVETGEITIFKIIAAHDPGKVVNPQQVEGQIEGGIVQAVGWSLFENFITEQGVILTDNLSTYLIPTVLDIPEKIVTIIDEMPDPMGPYGIRGLGEIPFIPTAPAIISAIYDATGIWFDRIPVTSERFLRAYQNIEP